MAAGVLAFALIGGTAEAHHGKGSHDSGATEPGNLFPIGDHYNVNLLAKKSVLTEGGYFACPDTASYQSVTKYISNSTTETPEVACTEAEFDTRPTGNETDALPASQWVAKYCVITTGTATLTLTSARNVIFNPRIQGIAPISITIGSGADKPGKKKTVTDDQGTWCVDSGANINIGGNEVCLEVTDWCTEHFPNDGSTQTTLATADLGDGATIVLPENSEGYAVFARVTGKPNAVPLPSFTFGDRELTKVQDEFGNDLLFLGAVTDNSDPCTPTIDRKTDSLRGNKVKQAQDISCLFTFDGQVCYVNDLCFFDPQTTCGGVDGGTVCTDASDCDDVLFCDGDFGGIACLDDGDCTAVSCLAADSPDGTTCDATPGEFTGNDSGTVCCTNLVEFHLFGDPGDSLCTPGATDCEFTTVTCTDASELWCDTVDDSCSELANFGCSDPVEYRCLGDPAEAVCDPADATACSNTPADCLSVFACSSLNTSTDGTICDPDGDVAAQCGGICTVSTIDCADDGDCTSPELACDSASGALEDETCTVDADCEETFEGLCVALVCDGDSGDKSGDACTVATQDVDCDGTDNTAGVCEVETADVCDTSGSTCPLVLANACDLDGEDFVTPQCNTFSALTWVFEISDFVDVLFKNSNNGAYNVKLRFYPLPLQ